MTIMAGMQGDRSAFRLVGVIEAVQVKSGGSALVAANGR